jgi:uncharacterized protein
MVRWHWKNILRLLGRHWPITALIALGTGFIAMPHRLERYFIYYPTKGVQEDPSMIGLPYEDLTLTTEDSVRLHGWFIPGTEADKTIMIFHGNAGNIGHRTGWIGGLHTLGYNIVIIDYRGYGDSEGEPHEDGLYRDATAAYKWWHDHRDNKSEKLILLGESLGGAVAIDLAQRITPAGLIVQSAFSRASDMAKRFFPLGLLQPLLGVHFDSAEKIKKVTCPKLFIHGNKDEIVPFHLGQTLFELAPPPKTFFEVEGAGHNDLIWIGGSEYLRIIGEFLSKL